MILFEKMSASSQNNGKKSSNNSSVNTPVSTPVSNTTNGNSQAVTQSTPPPNNAPKYGTLVPNRIFVGGISANTTEGELLQLFSNYGTVKAAKIIQDRAGVSKGYGFITFENEDDAKRPLREAENIVLRERKLNIAPAIKKQPFNRAFDGSSPPTVAPGNPQYFFSPGATVPYFQGGVTYYQAPPPTPGDPNTQQATVYQPPPVYPAQTGPPQTAAYPSMMFPAQTIYMPQQYHMPMPYDYNYYTGNGAAPTQYVVGNQGVAQGGPPMQQPPSTSSPPRPPTCYGGQQLAAYNGPDTMFYGVPAIYGPMDPTPGGLYTDCVEISNGGYSEEPYSLLEGAPQELEFTGPPMGLEAAGAPPLLTTTNTSPKLPQHHSNTEQPQQPQATNASQMESASATSDTTRQSNTPVVSILSIDPQQERDYLSMQSGRRRKPNPVMAPLNNYPPNGYNNYAAYPTNNSYSNQITNLHSVYTCSNYPPPHTINGTVPFNQVDSSFNKFNKPISNGYDRNKKRRNTTERRPNDYSSRSSLRTDSNSSASVVDENRNEERVFQNAISSPPPAPYSPMANMSFNYKNMNGARNFRNSNMRPYQFSNNNNNNERSRVPHNTNRNYVKSNNNFSKNSSENLRGESNSIEGNKNDSNECSTSKNRVINLPSQSQQVHSGNQNFVPPSRRSRRSIRRNAAGGTSLSEIGAGDAPVPNQDVTDTCKKMEALKL